LLKEITKQNSIASYFQDSSFLLLHAKNCLTTLQVAPE